MFRATFEQNQAQLCEKLLLGRSTAQEISSNSGQNQTSLSPQPEAFCNVKWSWTMWQSSCLPLHILSLKLLSSQTVMLFSGDKDQIMSLRDENKEAEHLLHRRVLQSLPTQGGRDLGATAETLQKRSAPRRQQRGCWLSWYRGMALISNDRFNGAQEVLNTSAAV